MNIYLIAYASGVSEEIEADYLERIGEEWVFFHREAEVYRVKVDDITAITKAK